MRWTSGYADRLAGSFKPIGMSDLWPNVLAMPIKISEIIRLLEADGCRLKRTTGSHRHFVHPSKPGLVTVAGKPSATLKPKTEASILKQAGLGREKQ